MKTAAIIKVIRAMADAGDAGMNRSAIYGVIGNSHKAVEIDELLLNLWANGLVKSEVAKPSGSGRPATRWRLTIAPNTGIPETTQLQIHSYNS